MTTAKSRKAEDRLIAVLEQTKTDTRIFVTLNGAVRVNDDGTYNPLPGPAFTAATIALVKTKKVYIRPARESESGLRYNARRGWRLARHTLRIGYVHPDSELPSTAEEDAEEDAKIRADFVAMHGEKFLKIAELVNARKPEGGFEHVVDLATAIVLAIAGVEDGAVLGANALKQRVAELERERDAIDKELRGNVCDPDPLKPMFYGSVVGHTTTYGLVAGIRRERDALRVQLATLTKELEAAPKPAVSVRQAGKTPIMEAANVVAEAIVARIGLFADGQTTADAVAEIGDALIRFGHTIAAEAERATLKRIADREE